MINQPDSWDDLVIHQSDEQNMVTGAHIRGVRLWGAVTPPILVWCIKF